MSAARRKYVFANPVLAAWTAQLQLFALSRTRDGRRLAMLISFIPGGRMLVAAIETLAEATTPVAVFDDHSHKIVGTYDDLRDAIAAADSFARSWTRGAKATAAARCPCPEIPPLRRRRAGGAVG